MVIDPNATVSEDLLTRYMGTDPRLKETRLRHREDLTDQSQSGYDMALADFGAKAGFTKQQIVDLMIHHRRIHGQRPRTRLEYFERTIAKASKGTEEALIKAPETPAPDPLDSAGPADTGGRKAKPDSAMARALLCDQISSALGIRVLRISNITGKRPTYQLELDAAKMELPNVSKLVDQRCFRVAVASAADRLIPKIKPKVWEQVAQMMLDALTMEDGGEETDLVGAARMYVDNYLSEADFIKSAVDQPLQTRRKPAIIEGQVTICSSDLQTYLNKTSAYSGEVGH